MDHQALLLGGRARSGHHTGEARRAPFELVGTDATGVDEGLDINVHAFGLSPTSLQLVPKGTSEFAAVDPWEVAASHEEGIGEIGDPDCFIFLHKTIPSLHDLGVMR